MKRNKLLVSYLVFSLFLIFIATTLVIGDEVNSGDLDYGLLCRYSFDETSGNTAFDSSGNEYNATFSRSDRWEDEGVWGGCLSNDHSWQMFYGDAPAEVFDGLDDKFTVAFWAKNTAACDESGHGAFFKGSNNGTDVFYVNVYKNSSTPADHYLRTKAGSNDETAYWWWGYNAIYYDDVDEWHHIAFSMDHSTKILKKYYDGELSGVTTLSSTDSCAGIDAFRLFCRNTGDANGIKYWDCYHGLMDELNIYNRVLTLEELGWLSKRSPQFAYYPNPADGLVLPERGMLLSWSVADDAIGHEVYFGDDFDDVNDADVNSQAFAGSLDLQQRQFDPGYLRGGRKYYWRVDEVFGDEAVKGPVWTFITVKNNIDLYLLIGQSNMCVASDVNPEDDIPNIHIVRFDKRDSRWKLLDPNDVSGIGPAPSFALGMISDREDTVVGIVHAAVGGTPQSRWLKGGDLYEAAMVRARDAMQYGTIKGVLWHQGESDAWNLVKATAYGDNLKDMIADIRNDLYTDDLPFVLGQLGDFSTQPYNYIINAGIQSAADDLTNVKVASPSGLSGGSDDVHFTSESQRLYGFRYAAKMMEMVGPRTTTADVDDDGNVDWTDLGLMADKWLELSDYGDSKDINNDGRVDIEDFIIMGRQWGQ